MNPGVLVLVIAFLAVGCMLGWHAQRAKAAHGDVRSTKGRLPGYRKERIRSGLYSLILIAVVVLILAALAQH